MKKRQTVFWLSALLVLEVFAVGKGISQGRDKQIPNCSLNVAARQKSDGKISEGIHIFQLDCWEGECTLTTVTLNQCFGEKFVPIIQRSTTSEGTLKVVRRGNNLEVVETMSDQSGETTFRYLFVLSSDDRRLTSFSGGYAKYSTILNQVITTAYVPFEDDFVEVKLGCNTAIVRGIAKEKR